MRRIGLRPLQSLQRESLLVSSGYPLSSAVRSGRTLLIHPLSPVDVERIPVGRCIAVCPASRYSTGRRVFEGPPINHALVDEQHFTFGDCQDDRRRQLLPLSNPYDLNVQEAVIYH